VDEVLAQTGRREQCTRLLPARMVVYYLLALALFADVAYLEVLRLLTEALRRPSRRGRGGPMRLPVKSALIQARARLGPAPLKALFDQTAVPLATPTTLGAWYRGWRLLALDGTCVDAPDTPANADAFGRPRSGRGDLAAGTGQRRGTSLAGADRPRRAQAAP
jgi:Insertion element 4 transposase N-terminal